MNEHNGFDNLPKHIKNDKNFVLTMLYHEPKIIKDLTKNFYRDIDIAYLSIKQDINNTYYFDKKTLSHPKIFKLILKDNPM